MEEVMPRKMIEMNLCEKAIQAIEVYMLGLKYISDKEEMERISLRMYDSIEKLKDAIYCA